VILTNELRWAISRVLRAHSGTLRGGMTKELDDALVNLDNAWSQLHEDQRERNDRKREIQSRPKGEDRGGEEFPGPGYAGPPDSEP